MGMTKYDFMKNGPNSQEVNYAANRIKYIGNYTITKYNSKGRVKKEITQGEAIEFNIPFEEIWTHPNLPSPISSTESSVRPPEPDKDLVYISTSKEADIEPQMPQNKMRGACFIYMPVVPCGGKRRNVARDQPRTSRKGDKNEYYGIFVF